MMVVIGALVLGLSAILIAGQKERENKSRVRIKVRTDKK